MPEQVGLDGCQLFAAQTSSEGREGGSQWLLAREASTAGAAVVTHKDTHEVEASASSSGMVAGQATSSFVKTLKAESCICGASGVARVG